ncbi:hypothetical protein PGTUg99_029098 [Puccinia graminis f. sp. tritici]|uniref:Uncharacterized protein n=1 Tax=Puccinia graminis f. sp. tritici TaxID=56615 RepID=A0A5B0SE31_PUCGR|nr:hypothetical protein PGTUg99_029098 [Puccinia graminis f. sp. tritici]
MILQPPLPARSILLSSSQLAPSQQQQALYDHLDRPAHTSYMIPPIISSDQHRPAPIVQPYDRYI